MTNIKCEDCAEYRNEWCEKIIDSPVPDMLRDCQYWHERKDMVEVIRCGDCKYADEYNHCAYVTWWNSKDDYCSRGKRREG